MPVAALAGRPGVRRPSSGAAALYRRRRPARGHRSRLRRAAPPRRARLVDRPRDAGRGCPGSPGRRPAAIIAALVLLEGWSADRIAGSFDGGTYRPEQLTRYRARHGEGAARETIDHRRNSRNGCGWNFPNGSATAASYLRRPAGAGDAALLTEAPLDLRVNTLKAGRDDAMAALARDGVEAKPTPLSPLGLRVNGRPPLATLPSSRTASSKCRTRARSWRRCWWMRGPACASSISAPAPAARPWRWRRRWRTRAASSPATCCRAASIARRSGCSAPACIMWSAAASAPSAIPG